MQVDFVFVSLFSFVITVALLFVADSILLHLFICNSKIDDRGGRLFLEEFWGSKEITFALQSNFTGV